MALIAVICDYCRSVWLSAGEIVHNDRACKHCRAPARVIPGCTFGAGDVSLFDELQQVVAESGIKSRETRQLALKIERALDERSYAALFEVLAWRLPALLPLQLVMARDSRAQRRAFVMLRTILEGLSLTATSGTTMPAIRVSSERAEAKTKP